MIIKFVLIILFILLIILTYMSQSLKREYRKTVDLFFHQNTYQDSNILTLNDIRYLPEPVQDYIMYTGVLGRDKINSFRVYADCSMQLDGSGWVKGRFEQNNTVGSSLTRLFYIKLSLFHMLPILGLHSYTHEKAGFMVKLFGLVPVVDVSGETMRISDTCTLFNDMCLFAPAALIDERIKWESIDDYTVKAVFKTDNCTVSALLYFNEQGQLINFITDDRYDVKNDGTATKLRWSTPIKGYQEINGLKLPSEVEAVWDQPEGPYCYFRMTRIRSIKYNSENKKDNTSR